MRNSADLLILEKVNQIKKLAKCHVLCNMHAVLPVVAQKHPLICPFISAVPRETRGANQPLDWSSSTGTGNNL